MLRFVPDDWLEGVLRPVLLADPSAGLYTEIHAPDWRFAGLALCLVVALMARRGRALFNGTQWRSLIGLMLCFYVWTWVVGNGRYFLWGLVVVGPVAVMAARSMPGSASVRMGAILALLALQGVMLWTQFAPNLWGLKTWREGPGLALEASALKDRPAVFLSIGTISYSVLVPELHPASRWSNIAGQQDLLPGMPEHRQLQDLLRSPLPLYVVAHARPSVMTPAHQPTAQARAVIDGILLRQRLALLPSDCHFLRPREAARPSAPEPLARTGVWFCPIARSNRPVPQDAPVDPQVEAALDAVEQRCPRFFPPGGARTKAHAEGHSRFYVYSDVGLSMTQSGLVYFKHFRALNPTVIGPADAVRRGEFQLDCHRLPGRYAPPWARD